VGDTVEGEKKGRGLSGKIGCEFEKGKRGGQAACLELLKENPRSLHKGL